VRFRDYKKPMRGLYFVIKDKMYTGVDTKAYLIFEIV
jgi:hypothetical protein